MNNSYPCKCGHIRGVHGYFGRAMHCGDCVCSFEINDYHNFKPDNLKYLELLNKREEMKNENCR
jgi:hypothetical protein